MSCSRLLGAVSIALVVALPTLSAQTTTRSLTGCTNGDADPAASSAACGTFAMSTTPVASGGTDVKIWMQNLKGAAGYGALDQSVFSGMYQGFVGFSNDYSSLLYDGVGFPMAAEGAGATGGMGAHYTRIYPGQFYMEGFDWSGTLSTIGGCSNAAPVGTYYYTIVNTGYTCQSGWVTSEFFVPYAWDASASTYIGFGIYSSSENGDVRFKECQTAPFDQSQCSNVIDSSYQGTPDQFGVVASPEPATLALLAPALVGLGVVRRRRRA